MDTQWQNRIADLSRLAVGALKNAVYPPSCLLCRGSIDGVGQLCPECWRDIYFLDGPACDRCGIPFEFETQADAVCAGCLAQPPVFHQARSVLIYNDVSKPLILSLKHADRTDLAPVLASWMMRAGRKMLANCDMIVPVPLHWRRRVSRRFNQSAELSRLLAKESAVDICMMALERHKAGPSQGALSRKARHRNVAGVFRVREAQASLIADKHIVLIDDVLTTGATANACAQALLRGGAGQIDVLTLARVALPTQVAL